jgi:hypothetical protein
LPVPQPSPFSDLGPSLTAADWERLAVMRQSFLRAGERTGALPDYWHSTRDLEIYDATFGARIGWKWDAVVAEMERRGVDVPDGTLVDWGAGTGVAARAFLRRFGADRRFRVHLHDRSAAARAFAASRVARETQADIEPALAADPDVLLASHVIDELDSAGLDELVALARRAQLFVWVESGAKGPARALSAARERLLDVHDPLLPCTHRAACGILAPGQEKNWCHHFARPAPEAFTTNHWRTFSRTLGIDLRALPYSMLVMRRRASASTAVTAGGDVVRLLGAGRVEKGRARFDACGPEGVRTLTILERTDKAFVRALDERGEPRVVRLETQGDRVLRVDPA